MKTKRIKVLFKKPGIRKKWKLLREHLLDLEKDLNSVRITANLLITAIEFINVSYNWRWKKDINISKKKRITIAEEIINLIENLNQINYKQQYDWIIDELRIINNSLDYAARQWPKANKFSYINRKYEKYGFKGLDQEEKNKYNDTVQEAYDLRRSSFQPMIKAIEHVKNCHI